VSHEQIKQQGLVGKY